MILLDCICVNEGIAALPKGGDASHYQFQVIDTPENREHFGGGIPNGGANFGGVVMQEGLGPRKKAVVALLTPEEAETLRSMYRANRGTQPPATANRPG